MELTKITAGAEPGQNYKQTEVGLIPEDWEVFVLRNVLTGVADVDHYMPKTEKYGIPYVMTGDLKELVGDIDFDKCKKISPIAFKKLSKKVKNEKGDIILARYATVGTVSFVNINFDFIVSYSCVTIKPDTLKLLGLFLYYYFKSSIFKLEVKNKVNANIQDNVGIGDLVKMLIPLPPTLTEQKAIATALSDVDALISGLEKLIAKKKAIKQGAMQSLLTPPHTCTERSRSEVGKRLEGFSGEWEETTLGERSDISKLAGFEYSNYFNSYLDGGEIIVVRGTNITNNKLDFSDVKTIPRKTSQFLKRSQLHKGDLVFAYVGTIGPVCLIDESDKFHLGPNTARITVDNSMYVGFLLHLFKSWIIAREIELHTSVGAQPSLSMSKIRSFKICIPKDVAEQKAIAQILSDMDAEIEALETKKAKYRGIKQGMMQELLTGKTRLV